MNTELLPYQELIISVAQKAGKAILEIYHSADFGIEAKADNSPLTLADQAAHQVIVESLKDTPFPMLSEEGKSIEYSERKDWEYFWMVDPLDGTKEFIKKNGEFTVNIALIHQNRPVLGVVHAPVLGTTFYALKGQGCYKQVGDERQKLLADDTDTLPEVFKIIASRSHMNEETTQFINQYPTHELLSMGSSLKFTLIAEGKAHVYPRAAPTMEWDTAAAQIVVEEAGGQVFQFGTENPVLYNKENLLNPYFVVYGKPIYALS
jgi:3'(2'), 5'-bisphosphate nucleotidase